MPAKKTKPKRKTKSRKSVVAKTARAPKSTKAPKTAAAGTDPKRVATILAKLDEAYPAATCELKHDNAFQLLISTILSAQCTDVRVNQIAETLYKKYPTPEAFAYANPSELEQEIRPTGFFRNKTKSIMGASKAIIENFGGQVPRTMDSSGGGAKDGERGFRHGFRHRQRNRCGYSRDSHLQPVGFDAK